MKQAIVILHGMGEQIPMATLNSFVNSVWTLDPKLVSVSKPDPNTGGTRAGNVSWAKPDPRNSSSELRRITTEQDKNGNYTDFYEYYWAHMMQGTTWEHVQTWLRDLLFRIPPKRVAHAWVLLWAVTLIIGGLTLWGLWPKAEAPAPWVAWLSALGGMAVSAFVSTVLIKRFGDVARYVKALPPNVAKRHQIRQGGVDLLSRLIDSGDYERLVVVAHSLGAIVAYDILAQTYARYNKIGGTGPQPERDALEQMIREAIKSGGLDLDAFQDQQARTFTEAREQCAPWIVSDFVTLGAPLTHAEFLRAESHEDLRARQRDRLLPTCPPTLEYDGTTKTHHFSFSNEEQRQPIDRRTPHHAALFAYTRWTNLYSEEKYILTGDLVSGPVAEVFGLEFQDSETDEKGVLKGIRDIAVLPKLDAAGNVDKDHRRSFISHNNYWAMDKGTEKAPKPKKGPPPHHIEELRNALGIAE
ncbi:hypothetical protein [Donghicola tyrosinivorans]|uniref:Uncharacterized protein n=1 Tax=Donghicola tyrosinivorans TaxID=1652492 RepID=A0A2T0WDQ8_9RHOB|nr:hypothetical protein [Donghicola tyrosinivorans]PRY84805.1 hypothetical protein CLV74_12017 [Donghicola tyrosinivorans]